MGKVKRFKVRGSGSFPMDMLRYDSCWPASSESAVTIAMSLDREYWRMTNKPLTVELITQGRITPDRWRSFGWEVVND